MKLRLAAAVGSMVIALMGLPMQSASALETARETRSHQLQIPAETLEIEAQQSTLLVLHATRPSVVVVEATSRVMDGTPRLEWHGESGAARLLRDTSASWIVALPAEGRVEIMAHGGERFEVRVEGHGGESLAHLIDNVGHDLVTTSTDTSPSSTGSTDTSTPTDVSLEEPAPPVDVDPTSGDSNGGGGGSGGGGATDDYNEDPVTVRSGPPTSNQQERWMRIGLRNALVELPELDIFFQVEQLGSMNLPMTAEARIYDVCGGALAPRLHLCASPLWQGASTHGDLENSLQPRRLHSFSLQQATMVSLTGSAGIDLRGFLYASNGALIALDDDSGEALGFRLEERLPSGTYFLQVEAVDGASGAYRLELDVQPH